MYVLVFWCTGISFFILEGTVILSQDTGSRTIIFNPGTLEPLTANEFTKVFESNELIFDWIHFEARPNIEDMIRFLQESKMKAKISIEIETWLKTSV